MTSTPSYRDLNLELETQLERTAMFLRAAFHVHSPQSYDWARDPADAGMNERSRLLSNPNELLDRLAENFDIACITDHMRSGFATQLAALAEKRDDIVVFPGVEVSLRGGQLGSSHIHLLAIFPPATQVGAIERIYARHSGSSFPTDADRTGREVLNLDGTLKDFAEAIRSEGGKFIVAHVDESSRGHRSRFRVTREGSLALHVTEGDQSEVREVDQQTAGEYFEYLAELAPDAVEIMNPADRVHYASFTLSDGTTSRVPCVIRSDHHSLEELTRDDLTTHVKVSRPTFECVGEALRFFETRIRFKDDLPSVPCPRIVGMRLRSPSKNGLFEDALIAFNPNLNCIVGSRGTGKSTIVEALRYALGLGDALEELRAVSGQINFTTLASDTQRANLRDTLIEVVYETQNSQRYCLTATFDPDAAGTTSVYTLGGEHRPITAPALRSEFPIRLYSWSEIETLGREPALQRTLLDRLSPELVPAFERRAQLLASLEENRLEIESAARGLEEQLRADDGLLRRFRQYKADFDQVNTAEVAALFADLDLARKRLRALRDAQTALRLRSSLIKAAEEANALDPLQDLPLELGDWWRDEIEPVIGLSLLAEEVSGPLQAARSAIEERLTALDVLVVQQEASVTETEGELRTKTQADAQDGVLRDQREERRSRYERAIAARENYTLKHTQFQELLSVRQGLLRDYEQAETEITKGRERGQQRLLGELSEVETGMDIDIEFRPGADREAAIVFMRDSGFLARDPFGHYKEKKIAERACTMARPIQLARSILAKDVALLEGDGSSLDGQDALTRDEAEQLVDHFHPYAFDEDAEVDVVVTETLVAIMTLEELPIDDSVCILLDGRPVDRRSPGQRSSAMLPLVALSETAPLVIDQPEDNLDNRMVGQTLTRILATLKEKRQIVVATHNPNIVVGGDAEQVVVLESKDEHEAHVETTGSIDDPEIIQAVVEIMEGGREAFAARNRRYGGL